MVIETAVRHERGKNICRRLRRQGRVPAVLYGGGRPPLALTLDARQAQQVLRTAGHNVIFELRLEDGSSTPALLQDWQQDPVTGALLHMDLLRVAMDVRMRFRVRIRATGEPQGVKVQGGIFEMVTREIEVECLPGDIPEEIVVDVSPLSIGRQLRVADLPLDPARIRLLTDPQRVIAHVVAPTREEVPAAEAAAAVEPTAEPEVIRRGKKEAEGEEGEAAE
jgi:large subunit ribosomal protein L25